MQTLKAESGTGAGLFDRPEWECTIEGHAPDPCLFDEPRARELATTRSRVKAVFETRLTRVAWTVREGASEIELIVDRGAVVTDDEEAPVSEIELELKRGDPRDLFALARRIAAALPVTVGVRSKSDRGYALVTGTMEAVAKAEPVLLERHGTVGEAFQRIARGCLRQFRRNETLLLATRGEDALHQARVGLRRLRSALSLFGEAIGD